jgi:uncharacterized protein YbcI
VASGVVEGKDCSGNEAPDRRPSVLPRLKRDSARSTYGARYQPDVRESTRYGKGMRYSLRPLALPFVLRGHLALLAARRLSLFPASDRPIGKGENETVMTAQTDAEHPPGSSLQVAISNAIVGFMREYTGRGPMKARTSIRDNVVLVMLEQTLTKGEQVLVNKGRSEQVLALRHEYQEAMRDESSAKISELTGRNVIAFMSANHFDPDLASEIYVLDQAPDYGTASSAERP